MSLPGDALSSVPDGPPLLTLARIGTQLHVTVVHAAAADLIWQNRRRLLQIHGCNRLRVSLLELTQANGQPLDLHWPRQQQQAMPISCRRR